MTEIVDAESQLGRSLPEPLRLVYASGDGRYRPGGEWWVVWPLDRVIMENLGAWSDGRLPRTLLAFGDDGTGDPFCLRLDEGTDEVLRWSWIDAAPHGSEGTVDHFMMTWVDAE